MIIKRNKLTFIALLLLSNQAFSGETVFLIDTSSNMKQTCSSSSVKKSALSLAVESIKTTLSTFDSAQQATIIDFSNSINILNKNISADHTSLRTTLDKLTPTNKPASLSPAINSAIQHILKTRNDMNNNIIIYTAGGNDKSKDLLNQLATLPANITNLEFNLFNENIKSSKPVSKPSNDNISINYFGCDSSNTSSIYAEIKTVIAKTLGIQESSLNKDTHIKRDLGLDTISSFEIISTVCEKFDLPYPANLDINTISDLENYVQSTPRMSEVQNFASSGDESTKNAGKKATRIQKVFYGTNRKVTGKKRLSEYFGGERSSNKDPVSYGICEVSIPLNHKKGGIESPFLSLKFLEDPKKHILITKINPVSAKELFSTINKQLSANVDEKTNKDAVVFVHGFNVTFDDAAKRTAQVAYDIGFKGAPIMFSWPSDGSLAQYMSDREDVTWSINHIEQFLTDVVDKAGAKKIHLIAHSMGNQGLIGALYRLALKSRNHKKVLFENIILAAPDFDAQLFQQQIAPEVIALTNKWTIYSSDNDAALEVSSNVNSAKRLGLPVTAISGIDVIDATGIEVTPWSVPEFHSYYATKQVVVDDIIDTIKGIAPTLRNLIPKKSNGISYWQLESSIKK